jgi:hypothetical protein
MSDEENQAPEAGDTTDENDTVEDNKTRAQEAEQDDQPSGEQETEQKDDPKKLKAQWEKANREAAGLRKRVKELEPLAQKAKVLEDAQKSELEKINDQLTAAQVELQGFRVAEIRRNAAAEVGLDPELAQFITAAEPDEAVAQAKTLADKFKPQEQKRADLKQGTRTPAKPAITQDDFIRRLAGYSTQ